MKASKRLFWILSIIAVSHIEIKSTNFGSLEPIKLTPPSIESSEQWLNPFVIGDTSNSKSSSLVIEDHAPWEKENWTWMRTDPGIKPYKVMDDLTFAGVPIFLAGIIAKSEKYAFRQNDGSKHVLLTDFKTRIDDYTQFFGPVMTYGLKLGGIEGRSDWGRLLASSAMSYGFMIGFVNGIKYTAKEMRPDGSTANSWPSGHTATAFVGATILHKEYGLTRSPWYSVAGYGVATATGVMRILNNRHWVSDVLSGAGIGIMSTELGYALSDVLFKGRGLLRNDADGTKSIIEDPSFFAISMGAGFGSRNIDFDMDIRYDDADDDMDLDMDNLADDEDDEDEIFNLKFGTSTAVSAEGAYFFNKYIGIGGRLRVNAIPIKGWNGIERFAWEDFIAFYASIPSEDMLSIIADGEGEVGSDDYKYSYLDDVNLTIKSDHLTEFATDFGVYFNIPISKNFAIGSKLLVGRSLMQEIDLNATAKGGKWFFEVDDEDRVYNILYLGEYETEWDYFTVSGNNTTKYGTGISLTYAYKNNFAWRIFADYDFTRKTYTMEYRPSDYLFKAFPILELNDSAQSQYQSIKKNMNTWIVGASLAVSF